MGAWSTVRCRGVRTLESQRCTGKCCGQFTLLAVVTGSFTIARRINILLITFGLVVIVKYLFN